MQMMNLKSFLFAFLIIFFDNIIESYSYPTVAFRSSFNYYQTFLSKGRGGGTYDTNKKNSKHDILKSLKTDETMESDNAQEFSYINPKVIPITILSGFLGSGKTTLLQHLLHNKEGLKIAIIVNDVASVNIDSKLVIGSTTASSKSDKLDDDDDDDDNNIIELSNGCACCSLSDELLTSLSMLVTTADLRGKSYDHIVVELSGISLPKQIRANFQDAIWNQMPLMERINLDTLVTVVDCGNFLNHLKSSKSANMDESPELFFRNEEERLEADKEWGDIPPSIMHALRGDTMSSSSTAVIDLLVDQIETADILVLNKIDQCESEEKIDEIKKIVKVLNSRADLISTSFGKIENIEDVLAAKGGQGVVELGVIDDHKDAVKAAKANDNTDEISQKLGEKHISHDHTHSHDHETHDATDIDSNCSDPGCTDSSHSHTHSHDHEIKNNEVDIESDCNDPKCTDPSHSHSHTHSHQSDLSHSHSHDHQQPDSHSDIASFVYSARRPFHPHRLLEIFLKNLPITRGVKTQNNNSTDKSDQKTQEILKCLLRSKGFCWLANSNIASLYWSHAGTSFEMQCLGRWWATLPRNEWPDDAVETVLADFDDPNHEHDSSLNDSVGDRRQEIVMIGTFASDTKTNICNLLDKCLLTNEEWDKYKELCEDERELTETFPSNVDFRMVSF